MRRFALHIPYVPAVLFAALLLPALPAVASTAPAAPATSSPEGAANAEDQWFDSDGMRIRYTVQGAGDPLLLIHGFSAGIETNWGLPGIIHTLTSEFQVIAMDCRGHGKSDKPHDPAAYGAAMAQDAINLLDHLDIEQAHVVGYSMGGFIAMKMLTMAPERFLSAVIGGAGWMPPAGGEIVNSELAESLESGNGLGPLIEDLTPEGDPEPTPELIDAMNRMVLANNDPLALAAVVRGMHGLAISEDQLQAIDVPTLFLIGSRDPLKKYVDDLDGKMPTMQVELLEGADHITAITNPDFVVKMREFFIAICNCA